MYKWDKMEFLAQLSLIEIVALQWANSAVRYFLLAGLAYVFFWKWGFNRWRGQFLYASKPRWAEQSREIQFSLLTTLIFTIPTIVVISAKDWIGFKLYLRWDEHGVAWYLCSYAIVFFLHDTYFYWSHRAMHSRLLYRHFHRVHHLSLEPSPLAAFAFHPLEAVVESLIFLIIPLLIPVHVSVLFLFTLFSLLVNIYNHLGFSLLSRDQLNRLPYRWFCHPDHHSWHHRFQRGNYGFYLRFWDRLMGTWRGELRLSSSERESQ